MKYWQVMALVDMDELVGGVTHTAGKTLENLPADMEA
jgi:hypothetical protein